MTVHDFEENVEPIVIATNREASVSGGASAIVYDFGEVLKIEPQQSIEYYTEDGEKIVISNLSKDSLVELETVISSFMMKEKVKYGRETHQK